MPVAYIESQMRPKFASITFSLLLVILGLLTAYAECAQAAHHLDLAAGHHASLIHCPDVFLNSKSQAVSPIQSHNRNLSEVLPSVDERDSFISVAWLNDHPPFWEPFSQQGLFRFEEVYRL
jgi:hypothetical protein